MSDMPREIRERLDDDLVDRRSPAWFVVGSGGVVSRCGGAIRRYGLEGVRPGTSAVDAFPWLVGAVPSPGNTIRVDLLNVGEDRYADVLCLPSRGHDLVVFLDCTLDARRERGIRQCRYELEMLRTTFTARSG